MSWLRFWWKLVLFVKPQLPSLWVPIKIYRTISFRNSPRLVIWHLHKEIPRRPLGIVYQNSPGHFTQSTILYHWLLVSLDYRHGSCFCCGLNWGRAPLYADLGGRAAPMESQNALHMPPLFAKTSWKSWRVYVKNFVIVDERTTFACEQREREKNQKLMNCFPPRFCFLGCGFAAYRGEPSDWF